MSSSTPTAGPACGLETDGAAVTVAVEDSSHTPAGLREATIAEYLARGSSPCDVPHVGKRADPEGKTVWAVIGPENRL